MRHAAMTQRASYRTAQTLRTMGVLCLSYLAVAILTMRPVTYQPQVVSSSARVLTEVELEAAAGPVAEAGRAVALPAALPVAEAERAVVLGAAAQQPALPAGLS